MRGRGVKMCRGPISIFIDYLLLPIKSIGWVMLNDNWGGQVGVSKSDISSIYGIFQE